MQFNSALSSCNVLYLFGIYRISNLMNDGSIPLLFSLVNVGIIPLSTLTVAVLPMFL